MKQLIKTFEDSIVGVASGFDRIVFQGMIRPLMYPEGAMSFFRRRGILFKEAKNWVLRETARLAAAVEEWSLRECGESTTYLWSSAIRKDEEARRRQQEKGIQVGLVGTWSCVEAGSSYRLERAEGGPKLRYVHTRCKHLYTYLDHPDFGFMNIRMQTWFPYRIQIAMNGREWLVRLSLARHPPDLFEKLAAKDAAEDLDRQEEVPARCDPPCLSGDKSPRSVHKRESLMLVRTQVEASSVIVGVDLLGAVAELVVDVVGLLEQSVDDLDQTAEILRPRRS